MTGPQLTYPQWLERRRRAAVRRDRAMLVLGLLALAVVFFVACLGPGPVGP